MRIVILNVFLYVVLYVMFALLAFGLGYASRDAFRTELMLMYVATAIIQIALNYVLYRKTLLVGTQAKVLAAILIALLYVAVPILM